MFKQSNRSVLKSRKPKRSGQTWEKINGRAGSVPRSCILFWAGPGSGQNFNFSFGPCWGGPMPKFLSLLLGRQRPGFKNPARADMYTVGHKILIIYYGQYKESFKNPF